MGPSLGSAGLPIYLPRSTSIGERYGPSWIFEINARCGNGAIVRAESLMKIYVPPQEIFVPENSIVQGLEFGANAFTFESWVKKPSDEGMLFGGDGQWKHIAQVYSNGRLVEYADGVQVASGTLKRNFSINVDMGNPKKTIRIDFANGWIEDLRVTDGVARKIEVPSIAKTDSWLSVPFSRNTNAKFSS